MTQEQIMDAVSLSSRRDSAGVALKAMLLKKWVIKSDEVDMYYLDANFIEEFKEDRGIKDSDVLVPPRVVQLLRCKEYVFPKAGLVREGSMDYKTWPSKGGD